MVQTSDAFLRSRAGSEDPIDFGDIPPEVNELLQRGVVAYRTSKHEAEARFREALTLAPQVLPVYFCLYKIHTYQGELDAALDVAQAAIDEAAVQAGWPASFDEWPALGKGAEDAARFYARTFPNSTVGAVHRAPSDFPGGKKGDVLTVEFTVCGVPCIGLNGGDVFKHSEAFSFQIATDDQAETDRYWNAIVGNGGAESACGWCKDKWGLSWQITPRVLTEAMAKGGDVAKRAFEAMMQMRKIDVAAIEAAARG